MRRAGRAVRPGARADRAPPARSAVVAHHVDDELRLRSLGAAAICDRQRSVPPEYADEPVGPNVADGEVQGRGARGLSGPCGQPATGGLAGNREVANHGDRDGIDRDETARSEEHTSEL